MLADARWEKTAGRIFDQAKNLHSELRRIALKRTRLQVHRLDYGGVSPR